jgi:hypothetical protein
MGSVRHGVCSPVIPLPMGEGEGWG